MYFGAKKLTSVSMKQPKKISFVKIKSVKGKGNGLSRFTFLKQLQISLTNIFDRFLSFLPYNLSLFRLSAMWRIWDSVKRRATGIFGTRRTTDPSEGKSVAMRTGYVFIEIIRNVNRSTGLN